MNLTEDLISQFAKTTNDNDSSQKETTVYGTIVESDGVCYVRLDGSEQKTPIVTTTQVVPGERVIVMIKNHTAIVTGNITSPSASSGEIKYVVNGYEAVKAELTELETAVGKKAATTDLEKVANRVTTLEQSIGDGSGVDLSSITTQLETLASEDAAIKEDIAELETSVEDAKTAIESTNTAIEAINKRIDELPTGGGDSNVSDEVITEIQNGLIIRNTRTYRYTNTTLASDKWVEDTDKTFAKHPYKIVIELSDMSETWECKSFMLDHTVTKQITCLGPYVRTDAGTLTIWASVIPDFDILIENMTFEEVLE